MNSQIETLNRLVIKNFKAIAEADIRLPGLSVLLGQNSSGKSSIIQALILFVENLSKLNGSRFDFNTDAVKIGDWGEAFRRGSQGALTISVSRETFGEKNPIEAKIAIEIAPVMEDNEDFEAYSDAMVILQRQKIHEYVLKFTFDAGKQGVVQLDRENGGRYKLSGRLKNKKGKLNKVEAPYVHFSKRPYFGDFTDFDGTNVLEVKSPNLDSKIETFQASVGLYDMETQETLKKYIFTWLYYHLLILGGEFGLEKLVDLGIALENGVTSNQFEAFDAQVLSMQEGIGVSSKELVDQVSVILTDNQKLDERVMKVKEYLKGSVISYGNYIDLGAKYLEIGKVGVSLKGIANLENWILQIDTISSQISEIVFQDREDAIEYPVQSVDEDFTNFAKSIWRFRGALVNGVHYLGPLRLSGLVSQMSQADFVSTCPVGVSGEFTAQHIDLLQRDRTEQILPLPPGAIARKVTADEALEMWAKYIGIGQSIYSTDTGLAGLRISVDYHELFNVGTGVSQVLPVLVICLLAQPGSLTVIEQPELHLHPSAQQRLTDFFLAVANSGRKLLIETHSEYLVTRLRKSVIVGNQNPNLINLLFTEKDPEGNATVQEGLLTDSGEFKYWPDGFFSQTEDDLLAMLEASLGDD